MWDTERVYSNSLQHQSSTSYFRPEFVWALQEHNIFRCGVSYWSPIVISVFVLENTELYPVLLCLSTQLCYIIRSKSNFILQGITDIVFLLENCSSISLLWQQKCSASFQPKFIPYLCSCSTANLPPSFPLPTA